MKRELEIGQQQELRLEQALAAQQRETVSLRRELTQAREQLQQTHPELYQLCVLRQRLHDWYEIDTTPQLAQVSLQTWIEDATALGLTHLDKFCQTLTNWQVEIVNFFRIASPVVLSKV